MQKMFFAAKDRPQSEIFKKKNDFAEKVFRNGGQNSERNFNGKMICYAENVFRNGGHTSGRFF